jgi:hypothetical protein
VTVGREGGLSPPPYYWFRHGAPLHFTIFGDGGERGGLKPPLQLVLPWSPTPFSREMKDEVEEARP